MIKTPLPYTYKAFLIISLLLSTFSYGSSLVLAAGKQEPPEMSLEELRLRPVTTVEGEIGDLLRKWYADGTAAGNVGDYYDNRDRRHSPLKMEKFPQVEKIQYSKADRDKRKDYGAQRVILPYVVFGNSSTSSSVHNGGSNVRTYYANTRGMNFLNRQYTRNNIYIYPAHRDYWQNVFPTNSPYLVASKGSSQSDQKYMNAVAHTLAAFKPEVKKKLIETFLLMPTLQMLLRYSGVESWNEYLTGKAHPIAGIRFDALKMVQMAHKMEIEDIPPLVKLEVLEEDKPLNGEDFFTPGKSIKLADTPGVIARIFRGRSYWHRMVVSVGGSFDPGGRELSYHWKVLRGNDSGISINPLNPDSSVVEIKIPYHEKQPKTKWGQPEANRLEIGVFVKGGKYYSAPGFITSFSLASEARTYDRDGNILEIGYGMGKNVFDIVDWDSFFSLIRPGNVSRQAVILQSRFSRDEIEFLNWMADNYQERVAAIEALKQELEITAEEGKRKLLKKIAHHERALKDFLKKRQRFEKRNKYSATDLVRDRLAGFVDDLGFYSNNHDDIKRLFGNAAPENRETFTRELNRLENYGIIKTKQDHVVKITPIRSGSGTLEDRLTKFEYAQIKNLNATVLSSLFFPGIISSTFKVNFVDQRLTIPKFWRDVYHYTKDGQLTGWTRYSERGNAAFNKDGLMVLERDPLGRCLTGLTVRYIQEKPALDKKGKRLSWFNANHLQYLPGREIWHYGYENDADRRGKVIRIEQR